MSTSVEARVPFLDHRLVELTLGIPQAMRIGRGPKHVLKRAVRGLIPDEIIDRPKQGFAAPIREWLRGPAGTTLFARLERSRVWELGCFDVGHVRELVRTHLDGPGDREALVAALKARDPDAVTAIVRAADEVCAHRFDLLGSGPVTLGERIDWHRDFKSGLRWEALHHSLVDHDDLSRPSDVKVVWELSRAHHWVTLGQAFWLTGDERYAAEFLAQWQQWMVANPLGFGVNWTCAMEAAIRAVNWLWALSLFGGAPAFDDASQHRFLGAIAGHGHFILENLEVGQLPGNHYLTDGVALLTLGIVLRETRASRRWLSEGQRIVWGEIGRQVTPDG